MAEAHRIAPKKIKEYASTEQREELAMDLEIQEAADLPVTKAEP